MPSTAIRQSWVTLSIFVSLLAGVVISCTSSEQLQSGLSMKQQSPLSNERPSVITEEANVDSENSRETNRESDSPINSEDGALNNKLKFIDGNEDALTRQLAGTGIHQVTIDVEEYTFDALLTGPPDGIPVILLHGFPSTNYQWRYQMISLANAGYLVFAPNQRGYSPLARPIGITNYLTDFLVEDILQIADVLGWNKFHLVGHDWGAFVAWSFAGSYPERLITLTPISVPHPEAFAIALSDPSGEQAGMSAYMNFFRESGSEDTFLANEAELLKGIYQSANLSEKEMEPYLEVLGTPDALSAALNWYRANSFSPDLLEGSERRTGVPDIELPTMHIWSSEDTALGRQGAELTAQFVSGAYRYEVFEGVNHWVTEVASDALNTVLVDFISGYASEHE